jgi:hypothetical protein
MAKIGTPNLNDGLLFIRHIKRKVDFGKYSSAGIPQPVLMRVSDQRTHQYKRVFGRPDGPDRTFQIQRRIR